MESEELRKQQECENEQAISKLSCSSPEGAVERNKFLALCMKEITEFQLAREAEHEAGVLARERKVYVCNEAIERDNQAQKCFDNPKNKCFHSLNIKCFNFFRLGLNLVVVKLFFIAFSGVWSILEAKDLQIGLHFFLKQNSDMDLCESVCVWGGNWVFGFLAFSVSINALSSVFYIYMFICCVQRGMKQNNEIRKLMSNSSSYLYQNLYPSHKISHDNGNDQTQSGARYWVVFSAIEVCVTTLALFHWDKTCHECLSRYGAMVLAAAINEQFSGLQLAPISTAGVLADLTLSDGFVAALYSIYLRLGALLLWALGNFSWYAFRSCYERTRFNNHSK
jgi:hypothetical protein